MLKRFVLVLLISCSPAFGAYSYSKAVTIDHTKVGSSSSTNFPMLFTGTYSYLATVANGGQVQSSSGYDIVFTSDSACSSLLNWEQESWNGTTGAVIYWVQIPTLSVASDTAIYLCYGNSAITSFQGGATGSAWDSNYKVVYHLPNGTTLTANDSTANGNNGQLPGPYPSGATAPAAAAGYIDGGASFNGSSSSVYTADWKMSYLTVSAWINTTQSGSSNPQIICRDSGQCTASGGRLWQFRMSTGNKLQFIPFNSSGNGVTLTGSTTINDGNWHYVVGTWDGTYVNIYVDGSSDAAQGSLSGSLNQTATFMLLGTGNYYSGLMDEVRVSGIARSADWIKAEYNNQSSPSTFYYVATPPPAVNKSGHSAIM